MSHWITQAAGFAICFAVGTACAGEVPDMLAHMTLPTDGVALESVPAAMSLADFERLALDVNSASRPHVGTCAAPSNSPRPSNTAC
jgi:hypothetical protein